MIITKKIKQFFKVLIYKYLYFSVLIIVAIIYFLDKSQNIFAGFIENNSNICNLAVMSGTFIGFLLTIATVYFSIPNKSDFKKWFIENGHHKIFIRIILLGTVFFFVPIATWIIEIDVCYIFGLYSFIAGCLEVTGAIYYLYYLTVKNSL